MNNFKITSLLLVFLFIAYGCSLTPGSENTENPDYSGNSAAYLRFYLMDNPGKYQQVNIDIKQVKLIISDSLREISSNSGIYNLLDFTNGKDTLIAEGEFDGGYLSQIRLILGDNNTIMDDSIIHDLKTPSAQTAGLKLNVQKNILPGEVYEFAIDFDGQKSIVKKGNGRYSLKPVIRVFAEVLTGSIHGVISPADADSLIHLIGMDDTITTLSDTLGNYMFRGLEEGEYSIDIVATSKFRDFTLSGIEVFAGQVTEVDTAFFE